MYITTKTVMTIPNPNPCWNPCGRCSVGRYDYILFFIVNIKQISIRIPSKSTLFVYNLRGQGCILYDCYWIPYTQITIIPFYVLFCSEMPSQHFFKRYSLILLPV